MSVFLIKNSHKQVTRFLVTCLALFGLVAPAISHTYFFGVSDVTLNTKTQQFEIIHRFTAHDIENAIAESKQIHFSPEHKKYETYVQEYIEQGFELKYNDARVKLLWLGFEVKLGKIIAYQEPVQRIVHENFLDGLVVKNTILVDTYPRQVNTVNFQGKDKQDNNLYGSLTFDHKIKVVKITADSKTGL